MRNAFIAAALVAFAAPAFAETPATAADKPATTEKAAKKSDPKKEHKHHDATKTEKPAEKPAAK
jgi:hypothetical protein